MHPYLTALDAGYDERANRGQPTGVKVSPELWRELQAAGRIVMAPAQIRFTAADAPGAGLPVLPIEEKLPTFRGAVVHVAPELADAGEFEFSPG
ncbi:hypothetical protein [Cupriavidus sp. TMH.W2]|uniref:hypothetical protein n=1 Tax=Cupriavidus sp. TMH.W2 TaxID=3434465 RepID=UPI003D77DB2E